MAGRRADARVVVDGQPLVETANSTVVRCDADPGGPGGPRLMVCVQAQVSVYELVRELRSLAQILELRGG